MLQVLISSVSLEGLLSRDPGCLHEEKTETSRMLIGCTDIVARYAETVPQDDQQENNMRNICQCTSVTIIVTNGFDSTEQRQTGSRSKIQSYAAFKKHI